VVRTALTRHLWWLAARMGLCLAGIGDGELQRLRLRRLWWIAVTAGTAAFLLVLGSSVAAGVARALPARTPAASQSSGGDASARTPSPPAREPVTRPPAVLYSAPAAAPALVALAIWLYTRVILRRALRDREGDATVCRATVRRLITARVGGWPVLLHEEGGRWLWLTGSSRTLAPMRARLSAPDPSRPFRLRVTLTYHPRCRVVKEISGLAIEQLEWAVAASPAYGSSPA
jgi:hypothetical protein